MSRTETAAARIRYINPEWRDRPEPPTIGSRESRHANTGYRDVEIHDARDPDVPIGLEDSGFTLVVHPTSAAGADEDRLRSEYRPEALELIREIAGADRTYMLGHLVRTEEPKDFNDAYAKFVHCDYNVASLETMTTSLLERRGVEPEPGWTYAWYNTWQPFDHAVEQNALAMLDVRSLADGDLIDYLYTGYDGGGGLVAAPVYNPDHRWWYYPAMSVDEVLVSKQLDLRPGRVAQCPHTSFVDETVPKDVPPRRSVETRVLAVFESG